MQTRSVAGQVHHAIQDITSRVNELQAGQEAIDLSIGHKHQRPPAWFTSSAASTAKLPTHPRRDVQHGDFDTKSAMLTSCINKVNRRLFAAEKGIRALVPRIERLQTSQGLLLQGSGPKESTTGRGRAATGRRPQVREQPERGRVAAARVPRENYEIKLSILQRSLRATWMKVRSIEAELHALSQQLGALEAQEAIAVGFGLSMVRATFGRAPSSTYGDGALRSPSLEVRDQTAGSRPSAGQSPSRCSPPPTQDALAATTFAHKHARKQSRTGASKQKSVRNNKLVASSRAAAAGQQGGEAKTPRASRGVETIGSVRKSASSKTGVSVRQDTAAAGAESLGRKQNGSTDIRLSESLVVPCLAHSQLLPARCNPPACASYPPAPFPYVEVYPGALQDSPVPVMLNGNSLLFFRPRDGADAPADVKTRHGGTFNKTGKLAVKDTTAHIPFRELYLGQKGGRRCFALYDPVRHADLPPGCPQFEVTIDGIAHLAISCNRCGVTKGKGDGKGARSTAT